MTGLVRGRNGACGTGVHEEKGLASFDVVEHRRDTVEVEEIVRREDRPDEPVERSSHRKGEHAPAARVDGCEGTFVIRVSQRLGLHVAQLVDAERRGARDDRDVDSLELTGILRVRKTAERQQARVVRLLAVAAPALERVDHAAILAAGADSCT